jgi:transposase
MIRDLAGKTGFAIVDAILAGERDPQQLARLRDPRCKHPASLIARSLEGTWREECLFVLQQARDDHRHFQAQIDQIDQAIEALLQQVAAQRAATPASPALTPIEPKRCSNKHAPQFPAQQLLATILGTDLTSIPGITAASLLKLIGELGFSHQPWPTSKHFAHWLRLCPAPQRSGDKTIRGRRYPATATRAAQILKEMALGLQHDRGPLGQKLRAVRARKGHDFAIKATAHQLAIVVYACWRSQKPFDPEHHRRGIEHLHDRRVQSLKRQAKELGYVLEPAA